LVLLAGLLVGFLVQTSYDEPYRPQFHFSPSVNWTNDPNGLVYYEGEYHLFYQYNPFGNTWGHMSWGHAVSPDLVHWEELPVALMEEDSTMIFSGSVVVDWNNSSGFGSRNNPPLVAIYTANQPGRQSQYIAHSLDKGRTWTHFDQNPILDLNMSDFRDPKVFWHETTSRWIMVVSLPLERKVQFYASRNLKQWEFLSDFGPAGSVEGIWECPDLFELPIDGNPDQTRWVLEVDIGDGSVAGGSGGQYFVGTFDGTTFTNDYPDEKTHWVDYGADFYAAVSWNDIPKSDGRRIWLAWMNNWKYANSIPTHPWRGSQTIARELSLKSYAEGLRLVQQPVEELQSIRDLHYTYDNLYLDQGSTTLNDKGFNGQTLEIKTTFQPQTAKHFGMKVRTANLESTIIGYDMVRNEIYVDRTQSGETSFHEGFAARHSAPFELKDGKLDLHIFIDWSSIEIFVGDGQVVLTDRIFPSPESDRVGFFSTDGSTVVTGMEIWTLKSAWNRGVD
jgi:fructan beta-fructosidase